MRVGVSPRMMIASDRPPSKQPPPPPPATCWLAATQPGLATNALSPGRLQTGRRPPGGGRFCVVSAVVSVVRLVPLVSSTFLSSELISANARFQVFSFVAFSPIPSSYYHSVVKIVVSRS
jgi:hypothetical protein